MKNTMGKINSKLDIKEEKMNDLKGVIVNDFIMTQREKGAMVSYGETSSNPMLSDPKTSF